MNDNIKKTVLRKQQWRQYDNTPKKKFPPLSLFFLLLASPFLLGGVVVLFEEVGYRSGSTIRDVSLMDAIKHVVSPDTLLRLETSLADKAWLEWLLAFIHPGLVLICIASVFIYIGIRIRDKLP